MVAVVVLLGAITLAALEIPEVVVVRTFDPEGGVEETRVWIADAQGTVWLEANNPETTWYLRTLEHPRIEVVRGGQRVNYETVADPTPAGHLRIRRLMSAKYGLADWWVGLLFGNPRSVAVRLDPARNP